MSFTDHHHPDVPSDDDDDITYGNPFHAVYQCYSPVFLIDRDRTNVENGGKILLPEAALEQLIDQTGIMLFRLKNRKHNRLTHCGVLEFLPNDEPCCYIPHWMMHHLSLDEGDEIYIESVHSLPSATFVRFQPQSKDFLDITNPKAVLEKVLRNFSCLTKGDLISINYLNRNYQLSVLELKPSDVVSIIECDMEVDFAPPVDYIESRSLLTTVNDDHMHKHASSTGRPFLGQGNRLNGKLTTNDNQEENNVDIRSIRGRPNYDYKYGLLQFPRTPLRSVNDEMNERLERKSSDIFQPFTGEGKLLRQPRTQRPK